MKRLVAAALVAASLSLSAAVPAFATTTPPAFGQPNVDCPAQITSPAGFNSGGFSNTAVIVYANDSVTGIGTPNSLHSGNSAAEAQYDVACFASSH